MFCPKCKVEYIEGFYICSDCEIDLVDELPPEPEPELDPSSEFVDYQEILTTFNPTDIAFIKSVFDAESIVYFFKGEHALFAQPADPVRLMVKDDQIEEAMDILKDIHISFSDINLNEKDEE